MKNLIFLSIVFLLLYSCISKKSEPIEKYQGKGIIFIEMFDRSMNKVMIRCKTKDSIFYLVIDEFDYEKLKPGDTIK